MIEGVREQLTSLLADWGAEMSSVLDELQEQRARVVELESQAAEQHAEADALRHRVEAQASLIETLRGEAEEVSKLRSEVRAKDLECERVNSELESQGALVRALRRDADAVEQLKSEVRLQDRELEDMRAQLVRAEASAAQAERQASALREAAEGSGNEHQREVEALHAELEARKTLVKSLRGDHDRAVALQAALVEKRQLAEQLEAVVNRQTAMIAELRRGVETWKQKYQEAKVDSGTTPTGLSSFRLSDTDLRIAEQIHNAIEPQLDDTVAIDMRGSLLEARRVAANVNSKG